MKRPRVDGGFEPTRGWSDASTEEVPPELRERAIRLVLEAREKDAELSLNAAVMRIAPRVGINKDTLRGWCKQGEIDTGRRPGVTTSEATRIRELECEARELKRANEILLVASRFFARELDPRLPW
jgi:transposase